MVFDKSHGQGWANTICEPQSGWVARSKSDQRERWFFIDTHFTGFVKEPYFIECKTNRGHFLLDSIGWLRHLRLFSKLATTYLNAETQRCRVICVLCISAPLRSILYFACKIYLCLLDNLMCCFLSPPNCYTLICYTLILYPLEF